MGNKIGFCDAMCEVMVAVEAYQQAGCNRGSTEQEILDRALRIAVRVSDKREHLMVVGLVPYHDPDFKKLLNERLNDPSLPRHARIPKSLAPYSSNTTG